MLPLMAVATTQSPAKPAVSPWLASLYAGVFTAVFATAFSLLLQAEMPILYALAFLLIGAGPVLGWQMATHKLGSDWKSLLGGVLGFIPFLLGFILLPVLVGALTKSQSIGKLFLGSLIGIVLGVVVFFVLATIMGQNPSWVGLGWVMLWAVWGGSCGAAMTAWEKQA